MEDGIRFGRWLVRPQARQVLAGDAPVPLGGRAFDLLVCLVRQPGRVVPKAELFAAVWPGATVTENNLAAQVTALRRAFGADAVTSVAGVGYQCGLPVAAAPVVPSTRAALAVLPFVTLDGAPHDDAFAHGVAEDILTALACFESLHVIARSSSFALAARGADVREIGAALGVDFVLEGSVRRAADRVRVGVQLVEVRTRVQRWAERYDRPLADVFALQDDIAARVAAAIEPAILKVEIARVRRQRPETLAAYELYLRALPHLYAMTPDDNTRALALLEEALAREPGFAAAQAHAAWCYEQRLSRRWPTADEAQRATAGTLARRALVGAGEDALIMGTAGFVLVILGLDRAGGLAALDRAVGRNPNHALVANFAGTAHLFAGDLARAAAHLEHVRRMSPADPAAFLFVSALACVRLLQGAPAAALALATESAALHPDWELTWWVMAAAAGPLGEAARAAQAVAELRRLGGGGPLALPAFRVFAEEARRAALTAGLRAAGLESG